MAQFSFLPCLWPASFRQNLLRPSPARAWPEICAAKFNLGFSRQNLHAFNNWLASENLCLCCASQFEPTATKAPRVASAISRAEGSSDEHCPCEQACA